MSYTQIRVRFAPSPTGALHLGGARTALFSWAFARHHKGVFLLRIEDTDIKRSSSEAVKTILEGMSWLGMVPDENPVYQTHRMNRYKEVINHMLENGTAYYCYSSPEEIEQMRETARKHSLKPKYNGQWRPEPGKKLPEIPKDRNPTIRFKMPLEGAVSWNDIVKGEVIFPNEELDDLIIARSDGTPTYNFCVAIDDWDMEISHVLRGDDHVNNTPKQINILSAIGAKIPKYGHLPMILAPNGEKLSKRHGAVSILEYKNLGYLPEAMINYLARLGWSHKNDEIFSREELIEWFDFNNLSKSSSQWDLKKLNWVNSYYIKNADSATLTKMVEERILDIRMSVDDIKLIDIIELYKERSETILDLLNAAKLFLSEPKIESLTQLTEENIHVLYIFLKKIINIEWDIQNIDKSIKEVLDECAIPMKKLALPLRIAITGTDKTPSINKILLIMGKNNVIKRIKKSVNI